MSRTTDAAIDHQNKLEEQSALEGFGEHQDEQAARRWFYKHPDKGLLLALEAARTSNNMPTVN